MTPKLRFSEFVDKWQVKKLGSLAELTSSKRVYLSDYVSKGIPFYRGKEISELKNNVIPDNILYISDKAYGDFKNRFGVPVENDILITAVGTLGNALRIKNNMPFYFKDGNLIWLRNIKEDPCYLEVLLDNNKKKLMKSAIGSSQKALTIVGLNKIKFNLPSKSEQQKIADFLMTVDDKISAIDKKVELLKEYKKGVMQEIFSQEIRFRDEGGNGFAVWENREINEISSDYDNKRKPISSEKRISGNFPYYGANGIVDYVRDYIFDGEYILVAEDGVVDITKYPIHLAKGKFWANNHCHILQGKNINNIFLYYALQNTKFSRYITGSAQTKLNNQVLGKITLNIPVKNEQQKIADFLTKLDDKINLTEQKLNQAKQFKKALLQRMFI